MHRKVDYIIVGQGLAGSALAWTLMQHGKSLMVYDRPDLNRSSSAAAGIFNPITGRIMTPTWNAEVIFPFLEKFYKAAEVESGRKFLHDIPVYRPFLSAEEQQAWQLKSEAAGLRDFVQHFHSSPVDEDEVVNPWGGLEIRHSGFLEVSTWMDMVREKLKATDSFAGESFDEGKLLMTGIIQYDTLEAGKIIFCNGLEALHTRLWSWLPLKSLKGETLEIRMGKRPRKIFNRGVFVVPASIPDHYIVGATYGHPPFAGSPTPEARNELLGKLNDLLVTPYEVVHQHWGIRPTSPDRKPMLGPHPANKNVAIFNGLGTKGVSLAPYFASELAQWLEGTGSLSAAVNINRFKALYSE